MKVSEIAISNVADYLKLNAGEYNTTEIQVMIDAAKAFVKSYTGLDDLGMDAHKDFIIVVYILCQDMYDNRSMYIDRGNLNKVVDVILGMHCTNLLPTPEDDAP